jgi:CO dehydrogenase maturation factor
MKPLVQKRILICGKGGSGKSSIVSLMAHVLQTREYRVILLDGDASNPGGLARLVLGDTQGPKPLIDFFGGREKVTCPVDDPSPLTRLNNSASLVEIHIGIDEIPQEYFIRKDNIVLFQVGKIQKVNEGCDGPMSKITRDFIVRGDNITLIDVEAGIEHFGRGIERYVDAVLIVVDPTFESFEIADRVDTFCRSMGIENCMAILNGMHNAEMEVMMRNALTTKGLNILGSVMYDNEVFKAGLEGSALGLCTAAVEIDTLIDILENLFTTEQFSERYE